uniref:Uncharacterized protein n=1 Tax=Anguilla anguilla TaxID=7936 RepID=A0A0E9VDQ7_ANGAN
MRHTVLAHLFQAGSKCFSIFFLYSKQQFMR